MPTPPGWKSSLSGSWKISPVADSIFVIVLSPKFETQTPPPPTAIDSGRSPTLIGSPSGWSVSSLTLVRVSVFSWAIHRKPSPAATDDTSPPVSVTVPTTLFVAGAVFLIWLGPATQSALPPPPAPNGNKYLFGTFVA